MRRQLGHSLISRLVDAVETMLSDSTSDDPTSWLAKSYTVDGDSFRQLVDVNLDVEQSPSAKAGSVVLTTTVYCGGPGCDEVWSFAQESDAYPFREWRDHAYQFGWRYLPVVRWICPKCDARRIDESRKRRELAEKGTNS